LSPLDPEDEDVPSTPASMPDLGELSADKLIPQPEDDNEADESTKSENGCATLTVHAHMFIVFLEP
jgi:hypothetical protein